MERGGHGLGWRTDAWMGLMTVSWVLALRSGTYSFWRREAGNLSLGPCIPPFPIVTAWPSGKECSVDEDSELVPAGTQVAGAEGR